MNINEFPKRLLNDDVIIKELPMEEAKTASGIYVAQSAEYNHLRKGIIMAKDTTSEKVFTEVGDLVVFSTRGGDEIKVGGEEYHRMREQGNVVAILDKEAEGYEEKA